jgi:hypothetical protein
MPLTLVDQKQKMTDKHSLNNIFQRYLNNECSTYEIKYFLRHFVSGTNDAVLREMIAQKLRDYSFGEHPKLQNSPVLSDDSFQFILKKIATEDVRLSQVPDATLPNGLFITKVIALLSLVLLLL